MGSLYSHVVGAIRPGSGLPTNAVLFPQSVCPEVAKGSARGDMAATGTLGQVYAPFIPGSGGQLQKNMRLHVPRERLEDRRRLLASLDRAAEVYESAESTGTLDKFQEQAYQLLLSGRVAEAFELSKEDPQLLERYDTSRYARPDNWSKANRGKRGYYTGQA